MARARKKLITIDVAGAANDDAAARDRARHRQLAAGQDGHRRQRSQLGAHSLRGRKCRRGLRSGEGRYRDAGRAGVPRRPGRDVSPKMHSSRSSINPSARSISRFAARARAGRASGPAISPKATFASMPATGHETRPPRVPDGVGCPFARRYPPGDPRPHHRIGLGAERRQWPGVPRSHRPRHAGLSEARAEYPGVDRAERGDPRPSTF